MGFESREKYRSWAAVAMQRSSQGTKCHCCSSRGFSWLIVVTSLTFTRPQNTRVLNNSQKLTSASVQRSFWLANDGNVQFVYFLLFGLLPGSVPNFGSYQRTKASSSSTRGCRSHIWPAATLIWDTLARTETTCASGPTTRCTISTVGCCGSANGKLALQLRGTNGANETGCWHNFNSAKQPSFSPPGMNNGKLKLKLSEPLVSYEIKHCV